MQSISILNSTARCTFSCNGSPEKKHISRSFRDDKSYIDDDSQYEGEFQYQLKRFLARIVLDALSFDTTDEEHGRRSFIDRTSFGGEDYLFKALRLSGLYLEDKKEICNENISFFLSFLTYPCAFLAPNWIY